ncbi:MAG: hypothetical protein GSR81_07685 [Desulfurococcales archaeon]|nr:hypothetical protein [Desulfurococcales archaeon]
MKEKPLTREEYFTRHERAVIIEVDGAILYSIDTYLLIEIPQLPIEPLACIEQGDVKLCYYQLTDNCQAVILATGNGEKYEVINYRVKLQNPIQDIASFKKRCDETIREIIGKR